MVIDIIDEIEDYVEVKNYIQKIETVFLVAVVVDEKIKVLASTAKPVGKKTNSNLV